MIDDLRGEAVLRLLRRLREMADENTAIENFEAYVAGIASRVIDDAVRVARPEWTRLKNRVRYLVTHDDRFRLSSGGEFVSLANGRTARVRTAAARELAKSAIDVLATAGRQLGIDDLVSALAERAGVSDDLALWPQPPASTDPAAQLETVETLRCLWNEIAALPPRQRAALLLHARDSGGESVLRLLFATAIVSSGDAAAALEIHPRDLASLLEDLPLSDRVIARRLGVTPQQVINLRKAARDRLARRMARPR
jgi:RNA polymerase sigma factor (sigma-70 family)